MSAALLAHGQDAPGARSLDELRSQLQAFLDQPRFSSALWGVKIASAGSGKILFESHADRLLAPASNTKLYTAALCLDQLGGDYRFATPVYAAGPISAAGALRGNLVVLGHGDPSWNERRLGTNFWTLFEPFITIATNAGIHRIEGDVIADATYFRGPPLGSSWVLDDLKYGDVGMISAFALDDNLAQVQVEPGRAPGQRGSLTVRQPGTGLVLNNQTVTVASTEPAYLNWYQPLDSPEHFIMAQLPAGRPGATIDVAVPHPEDWFAAALKMAFERHGIPVRGRPRGLAWPHAGTGVAGSGAAKLGSVLSPPLREVVRNFIKPSQNLEADTLLADIGEITRGTNLPPWRSSESAGLAALYRFITNAGVPPGDVRIDEGSGLSQNNLTTANATLALLQFMAQHREAQDFLDALPVAGVDGTLRRRMHHTAAAGNLIAKTGTLRWANALSGFVTSAAGERLVFSIMLNRYTPAPEHTGPMEIDRLAVMLANFAGRSDDFPALEKTYAPLGTLLITQLVAAPFPHPARADGHWYHDQFYSAAEHYQDNHVACFIPRNFQPGPRIDFLVHFHGWRHTVAGTLPEYRLIEQFAAAGKNAVLIVPQGPYNVPDSFGGKLEDTNGFADFMNEVLAALKHSGALPATNSAIGNIILSGHSGGYHVMGSILDHGGLRDKIREVWLFDALYGGTDSYRAWQKDENGRLLDIYTDHGGTREETENLMATCRTNGVSYFAAEDAAAGPDNLQTNKIVFLHTDMVHNDVVSLRNTFREFMETSCLKNPGAF